MKKLIYKIVLTVNILFALALLASYISVHIRPDIFAFPALLGLSYPYLLLINILFALLWIIFLKAEAFISIAVIAMGLTHFSNYIRLRKPSGDKTGTFEVLSYNVRLFNYYENKKPVSSERRIMELLKNHQPEIICLQELYFQGDPERKEAALRSALGNRYHSHLKVISTGRNRYYGVATLTRFPIVNRGEIYHPRSSSISIFTDIVIESDTFRIFNNHLESFRLQRRERSFAAELTEASGDKEAVSELRSISRSLRQGYKRRAAQAQILKDRINKTSYPVIVAGDFNDTPVSFTYRKIRKGLNDSFLTSGYGAGFTYRGNYPPNRIDYILYGNGLECRQFDIMKINYSDHYPIIAYFRKKN
ncbi:MAG TPA: endonuclease/exonuclease/phosphatase family protein [Bacteroidales bacterium]|nr:endonuclease/exonuclease/phosphatase family protein [Bacteroidales bacterium]